MDKTKTTAIAVSVAVGGLMLFGALSETDVDRKVNENKKVDIRVVSGDKPIGYLNDFGEEEPYYSVSEIGIENKDSKDSYSVKIYDENNKRELIVDEVLLPGEAVKFNVEATTRLGTSIVKLK